MIKDTKIEEYISSFKENEEEKVPDEVRKKLDGITRTAECLTYVANMNAKEIIEHKFQTIFLPYIKIEKY